MSMMRNKPKKALIVEDDEPCLVAILATLKAEGFDLGGKSPAVLATEALEDVATVNFGHHVVHIIAGRERLEQAVTQNMYDVCFFDRNIKGGVSSKAAAYVIDHHPDVIAVLISTRVQDQLMTFTEQFGEDRVNELRQKGKLLMGKKVAADVVAHLDDVLRFRPRDEQKSRMRVDLKP